MSVFWVPIKQCTATANTKEESCRMYVMRKNLARVIPPLLPSLPIHIERQITRMIYGLQIQYRWEGGGGARLRKEIAGGARRKERGVEK